MSRFTKKMLLRFNLSLAFLFFLFAKQIFDYGIILGIQIGLLIWSLYILCFPAKHGSIILGFPYQFITKHKMKNPEIYMWCFALIFSVAELLASPFHFFKGALVQLLYRILTTPWPYWLIIVTAALSTLYPFYTGKDVTIRTPKHFLIRKALSIIAVITLAYFSFADLIILLNMYATG